MTRASELIRLLSISEEYYDGGDRSHINGQQHALRVATLARRHNPIDIEMVFAALVHDLARPLSDPFHGEVIAEIVRDLVTPNRYQMLRTHGHYQAVYAFQQDYDLDLNAPYHADAMRLYGWEVASFSKEWTRDNEVMDIDTAIWYINKFCGDRL